MTSWHLRSTIPFVLALLTLLACGGCEVERELELGQGVHPAGWAEEGGTIFHGTALTQGEVPIAECRACHGEELLGGDVRVSCSDDGACHTQGAENCAESCHGDTAGPLPTSGVHQKHEGFCENCHPVPSNLLAPHLNQEVDIAFVGLAASEDSDPLWNQTSKTCSNTYCHGAESPAWTSEEVLDCNGCHVQAPKHDRFARVVDEATCADCHGGSPETGHVDGVLTLSVTACNACHGQGPSGAPPLALDGAEAASSPQVGAHRRHLDSLLPGRIGKVMACSRCHVVPDSVLADGHLDSTAPADVDVLLGDYNASTGRCAVDCHFDRDPGPLWSDNSGAERACDACHGFPPVLNRTGTRHPTATADLQLCQECHLYSPTTHVDGEVSFR